MSQANSFIVYSVSELAKKKQFHKASVFKDDQEKRSGAQTLESFKKHSALEQKFEEMQNCGLTDQEIAIKTSQVYHSVQ